MNGILIPMMSGGRSGFHKLCKELPGITAEVVAHFAKNLYIFTF